jgi:predicted GIY-YIG superfamily endonuclease
MADSIESQIKDLRDLIAGPQVLRQAQESAYRTLGHLRERSLTEEGVSEAIELLATELRLKQSLSDGMMVKHVTSELIGKISGQTRMARLFEDLTDTSEYRVETSGGLRICSKKNLEPIYKFSKYDSAKHYSVYVIELSKEVLKHRKFVKCNPGHDGLKPCVYVGMTGLDPEERFANHKRGYKANRYAKAYGVRLLKELFEHVNPMIEEQAKITETELAQGLRDEGYAVWQN